MANRRLSIIALLVVFTLVGIVGFAVLDAKLNPVDPLAAYRNPNGGISVPGGAFTKELQQLLFPPSVPTTYTTYTTAISPYPTLAIVGEVHDIPTAPVSRYSDSLKARRAVFDAVAWELGSMARDVRGAVEWLVSLDWLIGHASAVTRTWDNGAGTNIWNSATNWSGDTLPIANDDVVFDGTSSTTVSVDIATPALTSFSVNSGYGSTITVNLTQTATWGTVAFGAGTTGTVNTNGYAVTMGSMTLVAGGVLTAGASTITVNGNWNSSAGTFSYGTSTVVFAATSAITTVAGTRTASQFYNLTVNASITATPANDIGLTNVLTVNGTLAGGVIGLMYLNSGVANPLVLGGSHDLTNQGILFNVSINYNVPSASTYDALYIEASADGLTATIQGAITFTSGSFGVAGNAITISAPVTITGNGNLTLGGGALGTTLTMSTGSLNSGTNSFTINFASITFTTGTLTAGAVTVGTTGAYIVFGSSTGHTVAGSWTNSTTSASWDAGTGTVTFNSATGGIMTFAGTNLAEDEFNNVTFTSSAGTAQTFTMATRALRWSGTLTVSDTSSTTALATADLGLSTAALVVGNGGILTANATTATLTSVTMTGGTSGVITVTTGAWTVSGNWNTSGAGSTYTQGTGIVTFDATATITLLSTDNTFDDLTISAGTATLASAIIVTNGLIISGGTLAKATFAITSVTTLTMSGGDLTSTSGAVAVTGNVNISSAASAITFGSETWTVSGTWTNASTDGAVWSAGTATVTFDSATGGTMTFAGANLAEAEFSSVTFNSSAGTSQTFTMATRGLSWSGTLTISGDTVLAKATFTLGAEASGALTVGGAGTNALTSTSGAVTVTTVSISGTGDYIDLGSEAWSVSGTWTNATTTASWDAGTGTVTFTSATGGTMTFAGSNLSESEFNSLTFTSSAGTAQTFTMATRAIRWDTAFTISDGGSTTALDTASLAVNCFTQGCSVTVGSGGILTANASTFTIAGDWTSSAGTFTVGTSTVSITFTSTVTTAAANSFYNFDIQNSTVTLASAVDVDNNLTIPSGTLAKNTRTLNVDGGLTMSGGDLTSTSGAVTITGAVNISSSSSAIDFGSETWTVSGTWTNASTDGTVWEAGTGTVTFTSATGGTMTFAGANLAEDEFSSVTFTSSAATTQTFTMATRGLRWGGTLTITDTSGGTTLAKATFTLTGGALTISGTAASGLTSTSGAVTVTTVSISTVTAFIDLGSEAWTASGDWDNSSTSASWDAGTGTITFTSTSAQTMTFANTGLAEAEFYNVSFTGAATFTAGSTGSLYAVATITVGASATLAMGTNDLQFDRIDVNGTMTMDGITIPNIDIDTDTGTVTITVWTLYAVTSGLPDIRWTMNPSAANASIVFIVEDLTGSTTFSLYRDNIDIQQAASDLSGTVTFTFATGWSPHDMVINIPGLSFGGGGGGGGGPVEPTILWTWRHLAEDLTVQLVVSSSPGGWKFEWVVDGRVIGSGEILEYQFSKSGKYTVTLRATYVGAMKIDTPKEVIAQSMTFLGKYFPPLVLVLLAMWFVILVLAGVFLSDAGRLAGLAVAGGAFAAAYWLLGRAYFTIPLNSLFAVQMFVGLGLVASAGALRTRWVSLILLAVGAYLLVSFYLALIPSWA